MPRANTNTAPAADKSAAAAPAADTAQAHAAALAAESESRTRRVAPVAPQFTQEVSSADFKEPELSDIELPDDGGLPDRGDSQIAIAPGATDKRYLAELAFNEEPVTIRIEPSQDENAPMTVDLWVNGKGAEIFDARTSKWLELNLLPVGLPIITKRKYVEVLARTKSMKVTTPNHADGNNIDNNRISRKNVRSQVFSVLKDSPRGHEWLNNIMAEAL